MANGKGWSVCHHQNAVHTNGCNEQRNTRENHKECRIEARLDGVVVHVLFQGADVRQRQFRIDEFGKLFVDVDLVTLGQPCVRIGRQECAMTTSPQR
jgi:hypothetical protein